MAFYGMSDKPYLDADRYMSDFERAYKVECDYCGAEITEGDEAYFIPADGSNDIVICEDCIETFRREVRRNDDEY